MKKIWINMKKEEAEKLVSYSCKVGRQYNLYAKFCLESLYLTGTVLFVRKEVHGTLLVVTNRPRPDFWLRNHPVLVLWVSQCGPSGILDYSPEVKALIRRFTPTKDDLREEYLVDLPFTD